MAHSGTKAPADCVEIVHSTNAKATAKPNDVSDDSSDDSGCGDDSDDGGGGTTDGTSDNTTLSPCDNGPDVCVPEDSSCPSDATCYSDTTDAPGTPPPTGCPELIPPGKHVAYITRNHVIVNCSGGGGGAPNPSPSPSYAQRIYNAAQKDKGMNTRGLNGAPKGNECVAAVQQVLTDAGLAQIGNGTNSVSQLETDLPNSGYTQVSQSDAQPGDIVILTDADGGTHAGIYEGDGEMISNSSSAGTFSWEDTVSNEGTEAANADDGLPAGTPIFFHHG